MTPKAIVETALAGGLDALAICDHNSVRNVGATMRVARGTGLVVIPGVEITSAEEVHIVGLFPDEAAAVAAHIRAAAWGKPRRSVWLPGSS